MPRNGTGTYSLPQPPFVAGTVISSAAVNSDLSDIALALTGSLPRDGQAGMLGALLAASGSSVAPSIAFDNDDTSGFFLPSSGIIGVVVGGIEIGTFSSTGANFPVASGVPVGFVGDFAGSAAPTQWILCFGQAVSRTTYALLFNVIGTVYGSGDGVTTFNLPDYRGLIGVGADNMGGTPAGRLTTTYFGTDPTIIGDIGGSQDHTLAITELPLHNHGGATGTESASHTHQTTPTSALVGSVVTTINAPSGSAVGSAGVANINTLNTGTESNPHTHVVSAQGGGNPLSIIQPSIIINKIIYAGA